MTDIEDIWNSLKGVHGDPKLLLKKQLLQIENIIQLWKRRNKKKTGGCFK